MRGAVVGGGPVGVGWAAGLVCRTCGSLGECGYEVGARQRSDGQRAGTCVHLVPLVAHGPAQRVEVPDVAPVDQSDRTGRGGGHYGGEVVDRGVDHVEAERAQLPGDGRSPGSADATGPTRNAVGSAITS